MSTVHQVPTAAALVLRDRTNADPQQVFVIALYDLLALGTWTHHRARRLPSLRRTDELTPSAEAPDLPEPLRTTDAVLRRAAADLGTPLRTVPLAAWLARQAAGTPSAAKQRTLDALIAAGLLERSGTQLGLSDAGTAALAQHPALPPGLHLQSRHDDVRRTALKQLGPLGARLLAAIADTPTGQRGFAFGAVGAEAAGYGRSPNGDNRDAAVRYGAGI